jgi:hypothetical protein
MNQEKKTGLPILGYIATAAAPKPVVVQENIYQATRSHLRNAIESGTYQVGKVKLPSHFTELGKAPTATSDPLKWKETTPSAIHEVSSFQFCRLRSSVGRIVEFLSL